MSKDTTVRVMVYHRVTPRDIAEMTKDRAEAWIMDQLVQNHFDLEAPIVRDDDPFGGAFSYGQVREFATVAEAEAAVGPISSGLAPNVQLQTVAPKAPRLDSVEAMRAWMRAGAP